MRPVRIPVRVAPGPVLAGDRQLLLDAFERGLQVPVGDRPVGADAVARAHLEVRRMKAWRVAREVHHRPADAMAGVVLAHLDRIVPADDPLLVPVEGVRAVLVAHPVLVGIPERAFLEHDDAPARAGESLREHAAAGAAADDQEVDLVAVPVAPHPVAIGDAPAMHVEQERRVVVRRPQRALEEESRPAHSSPRSLTSLTGSTSNASSVVHASCWLTPRRL